MTLLWLVYFADVVQNIHVLSSVVAWFAGIASVILCFLLLATGRDSPNDKDLPILKNWTKRAFVVFSVSCVLVVLTPTKQTYYTMLAAYGVEYIATNERVVGVADQSLELLEKTIGKYLEEAEK